MGNKISKFTGRSQHTKTKQDHFYSVLEVHIKIAKHVQERHKSWIDKEYFYADICAGDGGNDIADGSPVIFTRLQKEYGLNCKPYFIDHNPLTMGKLSRKVDNKDAKWICDGHENVLPKIAPSSNMIGLLYFDPNGDPSNDYPNLLSDFYLNKFTSRIDCLLYFSATTIKRVLKAPGTKRDWDLMEDIRRISKDHWLIREPCGKSQWSFLLGTNWPDFPKFKKIGFHRLSSPEGQNTLKRLNYTSKEISENNIKIIKFPKQMEMFDGEEGCLKKG